MSRVEVDKRRARALNEAPIKDGAVIYWMSRDQRVNDNWALLYAQQIALEHSKPLAVVFCLVPEFLHATLRQYDFMLEGLAQIEGECRKRNLPFILLTGNPRKEMTKFVESKGIGAVITDFSPLRINRRWKRQLAIDLKIPLIEVDAHNIIPCWETSDKQEFAAHTIRKKIHNKLPQYLTVIPSLRKHPYDWAVDINPTNWYQARRSLKIDTSIEPVDHFASGEKAALKQLQKFIKNNLKHYDKERNDPNADAQSNLSPYLHFGQIAPQRIAWEVQRLDGRTYDTGALIEQAVVRRELSDNFCYYNDKYDSFEGLPEWAQKTLDEHRTDIREYVYSRDEFEHADTHDPLWNAAQMEMVNRGKMHGYMRMYWAKKILEWSKSPEDALDIAIYLNDRYELDGRDPNGYVGIAWSIGGVHDRPFFERDIFGKIRFMSYNGCKRKFDVDEYIRSHLNEQRDMDL